MVTVERCEDAQELDMLITRMKDLLVECKSRLLSMQCPFPLHISLFFPLVSALGPRPLVDSPQIIHTSLPAAHGLLSYLADPKK